MPPHCHSLDGPVVTAARDALESGDVSRVLPYVPAADEAEMRTVFDAARAARALGTAAREVSDRQLFETVVRLRRAGEGEPYTGLKPARLPVDPVIPLAEKAVRTGSVDRLTDFLAEALRQELKTRLEHVQIPASTRKLSVGQARRYLQAELGFEVYSHHLLQAIAAPAHGHEPPGR